jgi:predicted SnoaL-like aldol condensation-catalyzing enzyme
MSKHSFSAGKAGTLSQVLLLLSIVLFLILASLARPTVVGADDLAHALPPDTRTVALAFLQRCADGDMDGAYAYWGTPDFIQHNPDIADGVAGHRAFFEGVEHKYGVVANWVNVTDILLVDGDMFASFHHVFRSPDDTGRMFADIWRVKDGRIVEHWDIIQPIPAIRANHNGYACGIAEDYQSARSRQDGPAEPACGRPNPNASRTKSVEVVDAYLQEVSGGHVREAIQRWFAPDYRQHEASMADGSDGAIATLGREYGSAAKARPKELTPIRTVAEGDLVLRHRLVQYAGAERPTSSVDIFRVTDGRISEHWNVKQTVPEVTRNGHPMW